MEERGIVIRRRWCVLAVVPRVSPPPRSRPPRTLKYDKNRYLGKIEYLDNVQYAVTCRNSVPTLVQNKVQSTY